jgi:AbrB family looped-hinge helix DNA binding protein
MKNISTVSERGTITIPLSIRMRTRIKPGDIMQFEPERDKIILRHLIVKRLDTEDSLSDDEWNNFDKLITKQLKKKQYTQYNDLNKAKKHSRNLKNKR